jgi:hypothetical protein
MKRREIIPLLGLHFVRTHKNIVLPVKVIHYHIQIDS